MGCFADLYVKETQAGICAKEGEPVVEKESAATALVNGMNLLGPVVGNYCMNLALKKAQEVGIGWVVTHGKSNKSNKFRTYFELNFYTVDTQYKCLSVNENLESRTFVNRGHHKDQII